MASELGLALTVLRVVRGWTQHELARAARVRDNSISEFENGKRVPDRDTLAGMVAAMGYPPAALDRTRQLVGWLRARVAKRAGAAGPVDDAGALDPSDSLAAERAAALLQEVEQFAADMGGAVSRLAGVLRELTRREAPPP